MSDEVTPPVLLAPAEEPKQKRRLNILLGLVIVTYLFASILGELTKYVADFVSFNVWSLTGGGISAVLGAVGILLSYWWGTDARTRKGSYFVFLCLFGLIFIATAAGRMISSANARHSMVDFQEMRQNTCESQGYICRNLVSATDPAKRQSFVDHLFAFSGVNVLEPANTESSNKPPSVKAKELRDMQLKTNDMATETSRLLFAANYLAYMVLLLHLLIAAIVFTVGGFVFVRRERKDG